MKYINKTNAAGIHITEASPLDDRTQLKTEAEIAVMINKEPMPNFDGMVVTFSDTKNLISGRNLNKALWQQGLLIHGMMIFRGRITLVNCTILFFSIRFAK
jgi:hypothetical protein